MSCLILFSGASSAGSKLYFVHTDHLGTPQVLTDKNQNVVWKASQKPFGQLEKETEGVGQSMRFPGQYADKETGYYYNYYRDYDPTLGRYLQSDPIGLRGGLNTYAYVSGNPVNYVDPYGLEAVTVTAIAVATYRALSIAGKYGAFGGPKSLSGASIPGVVITPDGRVLIPPYSDENASEGGGQCEVPASEKEAKQMGRRIGSVFH